MWLEVYEGRGEWELIKEVIETVWGLVDHNAFGSCPETGARGGSELRRHVTWLGFSLAHSCMWGARRARVEAVIQAGVDGD